MKIEKRLETIKNDFFLNYIVIFDVYKGEIFLKSPNNFKTDFLEEFVRENRTLFKKFLKSEKQFKGYFEFSGDMLYYYRDKKKPRWFIVIGVKEEMSLNALLYEINEFLNNLEQ